MAREWIVFAICLGLGGHIAVGVVLHAPERWPRSNAGFYGLLIGLAVYVVVQLGRSVWWFYRGRRATMGKSPPPWSAQ
ncbi:MAG TPA: hypothetical protein VNK46_15445 [Nitrospiraceae bacterium]|nr:hypothetical protein [Nitrospiraceae bacterium]